MARKLDYSNLDPRQPITEEEFQEFMRYEKGMTNKEYEQFSQNFGKAVKSMTDKEMDELLS